MFKQKKLAGKGFSQIFCSETLLRRVIPTLSIDRTCPSDRIAYGCRFGIVGFIRSSKSCIIKSSAYSPFPFILWHIYTAYSIECFEAFVFASSVAFFLPFLATYTFHHRSFSEGNVIRERGREKVNNINNNEVTKKHARSVSVQGKAKAKSNKGKKSSSRSRTRTRTRTTHVL